MSCEGSYLDVTVSIVWHNDGNPWSEAVCVDAVGRPDDVHAKWNPELGWPGSYFCDRCLQTFDLWAEVEDHWQDDDEDDGDGEWARDLLSPFSRSSWPAGYQAGA